MGMPDDGGLPPCVQVQVVQTASCTSPLEVLPPAVPPPPEQACPLVIVTVDEGGAVPLEFNEHPAATKTPNAIIDRPLLNIREPQLMRRMGILLLDDVREGRATR
jgi:hypothetical protein